MGSGASGGPASGQEPVARVLPGPQVSGGLFGGLAGLASRRPGSWRTGGLPGCPGIWVSEAGLGHRWQYIVFLGSVEVLPLGFLGVWGF